MVSFSLLQWILQTQKSNQGLPQSRTILYQLSYQGSPKHQQAKFKAMPAGEARLADLSVIHPPPPTSPPPYPPRAHPGLNKEA